jgi:hypothetical protein
MKLLSFSIFLSSLLFTFNYVWINRITVISQSNLNTVLMNKWTGKHCVFYINEELRNHPNFDATNNCRVDDNNKIELP